VLKKSARRDRAERELEGLGEIAENGPTGSTVLDPCPDATFHPLTVVFKLDCTEEAWASKLH